MAFIVEGAAPPDHAAVDDAVERRMRPAILRTRLNRHNILMGEQGDRLQSSIGSRPAINKRMGADDLALHCAMRCRISINKKRLKTFKSFSNKRRVVIDSDCLKPDRLRKTRCGV